MVLIVIHTPLEYFHTYSGNVSDIQWQLAEQTRLMVVDTVFSYCAHGFPAYYWANIILLSSVSCFSKLLMQCASL